MIDQELPIEHEPSAHVTDEYLQSLGDSRTARHASESGRSPDPADVASALRAIRADIRDAYPTNPDEAIPDSGTPLDEMKDDYWARASRVGAEHGARPGHDLDRYFVIDEGRSYAEMSDLIKQKYSAGSAPRGALDAIQAYSEGLDINPAIAAGIMMGLVGRNLPAIRRDADKLQHDHGMPKVQASADAFTGFLGAHTTTYVQSARVKYGAGEEAIRPVVNKPSFYPAPEELDGVDAYLTLSADDAAGLVDVYDIQSRPYDNETLAMGNEIAQIPAMQQAMIQIHEDLVATSVQYLLDHPERASGNLENFSEVFVPEYREGKMQLLPNPKLIRAMVNNIMPGIALSLMRTKTPIEGITREHVTNGVNTAAKEYKLFQSKIGQFRYHDESQETVDLHSVFEVVCPANAMFPEYLAARMPGYFEDFMEASLGGRAS